ncbi:porin [Thalassolituus hydrocarboniclasticus]|uniref:Porin n=1 Tax=Thalassolituus hydrocarboniclasticus TaxID=2742796 RepID=A0ABY6ACI5_9GAMM|nr:porin [Thalassolituus hydrocarboniclasticus]UXD88487.1 porin [Thalassolituus hydrocarboniclasticus]
MKTRALLLAAAITSSNLALADDNAQLKAEIEALKAQLNSLADTVEQQGAASQNSGVNIGGYGEMHLNLANGKGNEIDYHRFVLFFSKEFNERTRFFSEFELEHSLAGDGKPGEVELEQAYIEYDLNANTRAKAGLFLIPVGILNETHEPDTFYGVERNSVENKIIPTTWWEGGAGLSGKIADGLSYDVAMHSGLESLDGNLRSGRQKVAEAKANKAAYTARVKYTAVPGLELAATLQYQDDLLQGNGPKEIGARLIETHAIYQNNGFELRTLYAQWDLDKDINTVTSGASKQTGFYVEPSYRMNDVGVFYRNSGWDTNAGDRTDSKFERHDVGVNYWLAETVVFKADYYRQKEAGDLAATGYNLGVGYSF